MKSHKTESPDLPPTEGSQTPLKKPNESVNGASSSPDPVIKQAKRDLDAGLVDTDMRATSGLDAKRRAKLVPSETEKSAK